MPRKPIKPPVLLALNLLPDNVGLAAGYTQQFKIVETWSDGSTTIPLVTYTTSGGSITSAGLYTAPSIPGNYYVTVTQMGGSISDTSLISVYVLNPPPTGSVSGSGSL